MRTDSNRWNELKFQTCVCFTNPVADLSRIREQLASEIGVRRKPWEHSFKAITPHEMPAWVDALRFGVSLGARHNFDQYKLKPETILKMVQLALGVVEWSELVELMPDGEPWGYLLIGDDPPQRIALLKDTITVGRSPENTIVVLDAYGRVSRRHVTITREINRVTIQDLGSKNGSYINSKRIVGTQQLVMDQQVVLGGPQLGDGNFGMRLCRPKTETSVHTAATLPD